MVALEGDELVAAVPMREPINHMAGLWTSINGLLDKLFRIFVTDLDKIVAERLTLPV